MLRASHRVLRHGGRAAAVVIEIAPDLDEPGRRQARLAGPPHAATRSTYPSLFGSAGFGAVDAIDLTVEYRATATAWLTERRLRYPEYRAVVGDAIADDQERNGAAAVRAIDAGLLRRTLYLARRP